MPLVGDYAGSLAAIEQTARDLVGRGVHVVALGGDHTISLPLLRATAARHGPLALVHFDAHPDTWAGTATVPLFHGSPFRCAVEEGLVDPRAFIQIGLRSPVACPVMKWTCHQGITCIDAESVHLRGIDWVTQQIIQVIGERKVYLTFDVDALDPSQAPGTSTPEVGGLWTWQALAILKRVGALH